MGNVSAGALDDGDNACLTISGDEYVAEGCLADHIDESYNYIMFGESLCEPDGTEADSLSDGAAAALCQLGQVVAGSNSGRRAQLNFARILLRDSDFDEKVRAMVLEIIDNVSQSLVD